MAQIRALRILLAEDNVDHAEMMIDSLKEFNIGNRMAHVADGEMLMKYLRQEPPYNTSDAERPDLILLDLKMPRMDGISALQAIKSDAALKSIPVLMVTTSTMQSEINRCFELGASSYLTKPLQLEEFIQRIKELNMYWVLTNELPS